MTLPSPLLVLTDRGQCSRPLPDVVAAAVDHGARTVVLREKDLPDAERRRLADQLRTVLEPVEGLLVHAGLTGSQGAAAVHLSAVDPLPPRRPVLLGRSCHSAAELARAATEGCDYVTLSPMFPTQSKPGYGPALGVAGLVALVGPSSPVPAVPPVYALGGVRPEHVSPCLSGGARGVAVMGPVMRNPSLVAEYLAALDPDLT